MGMENLEMRLDVEMPFTLLEKVMEYVKYSSIVNIICFIRNNHSDLINYENLVALHPKLTKIVFVNYKETEKIIHTNISFSKEEYTETKNQFITDKYFINLNFYLESLCYNPYLNKKVYISPLGHIQNDSHFENIYGNVQTHSLQDIILSNAFQSLWKINNDKIEELKNNPMRYSILNTKAIYTIGESKYRVCAN